MVFFQMPRMISDISTEEKKPVNYDSIQAQTLQFQNIIGDMNKQLYPDIAESFALPENLFHATKVDTKDKRRLRVLALGKTAFRSTLGAS